MYYVKPKIVLKRVSNIILYKHKCSDCGEFHYINNEKLNGLEPLFCESCAVDIKKVKKDELVDFYSGYKIIGVENTTSMATSRLRKYSVSKKQAKKLIEMYGTICQYCYKDCGLSDDLTIDHIYPVSAGGTNALNNLVVSCRKCNCHLGNMLFNDLVEKQEYISNLIKNNKYYLK